MTFPTAAAITTRRRSFAASAGAVITPLVGGGGSSVPPKWHLVKVPPRLAAVCVLERRLGAVLDPELRKEMLYVEFHRVIGQTEPLGDLRVGQASGDEGPDLALARRQITWSAGTTFDPAPRRLREHQLAGVHLADRGERLLGRLGLERETLGASVQGRAERLAVVVGREHQKLGRRRPFAQRGDDCCALDGRELQIEDDYVGLVLLDQSHHFGAIRGPGRDRSEERRVGKECGARRSQCDSYE